MNKLIKKLPLIFLFLTACPNDEVRITTDIPTTSLQLTDSHSTTDSGQTSEITEITSSSTSLSESSESDTGDTGDTEISCMISRDGEKGCPSGLVCIALSFTQEGQCVIPCDRTVFCPDNLTCQDWTALSQPQLSENIGVCL